MPPSRACLALRFSLRRMCWTWILTVVSAISSARPISLLLAPRAIRARISCSRGDRLWIGSASLSGAGGGGTADPAGGRAWNAATSLSVISGLTGDSPRTTRTIAATSTSLSTVLSR